MEDAMVTHRFESTGDWLFAVFDGHGGPEIAIFCKVVLPRVLQWHIDDLESPHVHPDDVRKEALRRAVISMDGVIRGKQGRRLLAFTQMHLMVPESMERVAMRKDFAGFLQFVDIVS